MSVKVLPQAYSFEIRFTRKSAAAGRAEILRKGAEDWEPLKMFTGSRATLSIKPSQPGFPETVHVRMAVCIREDKPLGNYSEIKKITLMP